MTLVKSYISEYQSEEENPGSPPTVTKALAHSGLDSGTVWDTKKSIHTYLDYEFSLKLGKF